MIAGLVSDEKREPVFKIGKYIVGELLGAGGEGQVYEVVDSETDKHFAMKFVVEDGDSGLYTSKVERLLNERHAMFDIGRHQHIVPLIDAGHCNIELKGGGRGGMPESAPCYYNVMEMVDSADLEREAGDIEPWVAASIGAGIAYGCDAAHAAGWVHRDVKPDNMLVEWGEYSLLADFGLAYRHGMSDKPVVRMEPKVDKKEKDKDKMETFVAEDGTLLGTPTFMSPEQADGRLVGPESDVYNLGASLYFLLTGRTPHKGEDPMELIYKAKHEHPRTVMWFKPNVPDRLNDVVMRMMGKDPKKRGSAWQAAEELKCIVLAEHAMEYAN